MKISEKMLEDWVCENPEDALWNGVEIIGRQIQLNHGRLDVLAWDGRTIVIELKVRALQERDVGQVLRYSQNIRAGLQWAASTLYDRWWGDDVPKTFENEIFDHEWFSLHGYEEGLEATVLPMLIGTKIDSKTQAAAEGANVHVYLWDYRNGAFMSEFAGCLGWASIENDPIPNWAMRLSDKMLDSCNHAASVLFQKELCKLFKADVQIIPKP